VNAELSRTLRTLLVIIIAGLFSIFGTEPGLAQTSGEPLFSLDAAVQKSELEIKLAAGLAADCHLESALRAEGREPVFRLPFCRLKGGNFDFFIGRASLGQAQALRKSPTAQVSINPGSPWSAEAESKSAGFLAGFRWGGFSCFALCDSGSIIDLGNVGPDFRLPVLSFKAAAAEAVVQRGNFSLALGSCAAHSKERESPEGWQSGEGFEPEYQALSIAASAALTRNGIGLNLWSGLCLGSLIPPGLAGVLELRLGGNRSGGTRPNLGLHFKAYACGESYRNHLLEKPSLDCALAGEITFSFRRFSIRASLLSSSPLEDKDLFGARIIAEQGLSALLWRWRTQDLAGRAGLTWGPWDVSVRAKADRGGLASFDLGLGYAGEGKGSNSLRLKAAAHLYLVRESSEQGEEADSDLFADEADEDWTWGDSNGSAGFSGALGALSFHRVKLETGLAWGASAAGGSAALALAVSNDDTGLRPRVYGEITQRFCLGARCSLQLSLASPSGGYALDCLPETIPTLGLGLQLREGAKAASIKRKQ
jgi:hypothetical protein